MIKYTDFLSESFGRIVLVATNFGLSHVVFPDMTQEEAERVKLAITDAQRDDKKFSAIVDKLSRYLKGEYVEFTHIPLDLSNCKPFQRDALNIVRQIPYGEVRTYKWVAECLGRPKAPRQVGQALARNPMAILIPCHRVIGKEGNLRGYRLGLSMKQKLLMLEKIKI